MECPLAPGEQKEVHMIAVHCISISKKSSGHRSKEEKGMCKKNVKLQTKSCLFVDVAAFPGASEGQRWEPEVLVGWTVVVSIVVEETGK